MDATSSQNPVLSKKRSTPIRLDAMGRRQGRWDGTGCFPVKQGTGIRAEYGPPRCGSVWSVWTNPCVGDARANRLACCAYVSEHICGCRTSLSMLVASSKD
jgi:hypothetical protein